MKQTYLTEVVHTFHYSLWYTLLSPEYQSIPEVLQSLKDLMYLPTDHGDVSVKRINEGGWGHKTGINLYYLSCQRTQGRFSVL